MNHLFDAVTLGLLALLPLINPPTTVALFLALSQGFSREEKNQQAFLTAFYVFVIMLVTYYIGEFVMGVFSISIPGLRIAGGGILVVIGSSMLFPKPRETASGDSAAKKTS
uniref:MarC family protein n=3 Tax=Pseudomonas TaxID=286 RepID=UPI002412C6B1